MAGCATHASSDGVGSTASSVDADATISFNADFTTTTSGALTAGQTVRVAYDTARTTTCRGDTNGHPGWSVTGFWRVDGGAISTFEAGGFSPSGGTEPPVFAVPRDGDLEIWFQTTSVWGCSSFDSNLGNNYHFTVGLSARAPGWIGSAASVISRETCNNGPCENDRVALDGGFTYDTWSRERAAIAGAYFDVWKQGVTDVDDPNLWKDLDVEVFFRIGDSGPFTMHYVSFEERAGNNARYTFSLRDLDPVGGVNGGALTGKSQCPTFPITVDPSGQYIQADLQFHMTVNGTELRPAAGGEFHGTYANYKGLYAVCLSF